MEGGLTIVSRQKAHPIVTTMAASCILKANPSEVICDQDLANGTKCLSNDVDRYNLPLDLCSQMQTRVIDCRHTAPVSPGDGRSLLIG